MPRDIDYRLGKEDLKQGAAMKAMRYAVLSALCGADMFKAGNIPLMLEHARQLWWTFLAAAHERQWPLIRKEEQYHLMRNCPPFSVKALRPAWVCRYHRFCPFCWAREVVMPLFVALACALGVWSRTATLANDDKRKRTKGLKLVEFAYQERLMASDPRFNWRWVKDKLGERKKELDAFHWQGAFVIQHLQPIENGLLLTRRGVALTDSEPPPALGGLEVKVYAEFTRTLLALVTARVARYPAKLLTGPPAATLCLLEKIKHIRMSDYYGSLRGYKNRI